MAKSDHSKDKQAYEIVAKELQHIEELIRGHQKLLLAILVDCDRKISDT